MRDVHLADAVRAPAGHRDGVLPAVRPDEPGARPSGEHHASLAPSTAPFDVTVRKPGHP